MTAGNVLGITIGSSMHAITFTAPPHSLQVSMYPRAPSLDAVHQFTLSILNTRLSRFAHDIAICRCAGNFSEHSSSGNFLLFPRFAGVTSARHLLFGANTP